MLGRCKVAVSMELVTYFNLMTTNEQTNRQKKTDNTRIFSIHFT